LIAGADRFGDIKGPLAAAPILKKDKLVGYAFLNSDIVNATGYSGKPIQIVVGIDLKGRIAGAKLVKHHEPIVLVGIPERRLVAFIDAYRGRKVADLMVEARQGTADIDIISGATVSVMVIDDSIRRSAIKIARQFRLGGLKPPRAATGEQAKKTIDMSIDGVADWQSLLKDGSIRRLHLTIGEINQAFERAGNKKAAARPEAGAPDDDFIDLYAALVSIPRIGKSLLGEAEYALLTKRLKPGQQAVLFAANGVYSFKGSGYVRGGIFDRIQLIQGDSSARFRDRHHKRLGEIAAAGAPKFKEIALFVTPKDFTFDPTKPWRLQLLVHRATGALEKAFLTFELHYATPQKYIKTVPPAAPQQITPGKNSAALWQRMWRARAGSIIVTLLAIGALTGLFFFQDWFARRPRLANIVRIGFLLFTVGWLGFYAKAQLSVVNVFAFANALLTDFRWDYFLMEPLTFILWLSVAASLLFWGRGVFCGWLCPFGALHELTNRLAKWLRIPQITVPWQLHERLWPLKYVIFLALFGLSLYSLNLAERLSEVEPFKTAIVLHFARAWPFVLFAVGLLVAGLFIERVYCRYLCPLGAVLAIVGRNQMFTWLRRYKDCGSPCQRCANDCMVQAIHPDGHINLNECLYCLNCQMLYYDDHKCPVVIAKRLRREKRLALQSKSFALPPD